MKRLGRGAGAEGGRGADIIACLYADENDPVENEDLVMRE